VNQMLDKRRWFSIGLVGSRWLRGTLSRGVEMGGRTEIQEGWSQVVQGGEVSVCSYSEKDHSWAARFSS